MERKKILFISLNGHQQRYFDYVSRNIAEEYEVDHVRYGTTTFQDAFRKAVLPSGLSVSQTEIDQIIQFLLVKAQYRNFGAFRRFMHSKDVLVRQTIAAIRFFHDYIQSHHIDLVCVWNGTLVPLASAVLAARKLGKKTLFFENGYLPGTTTVDPKGVNFMNSITGKDSSFFQSIQPDPVKLAAIFRVSPSVRALKTKWYHSLLKRSRQKPAEQVQLPKKYVFLPFQVHDDTQVLLHSPAIKTMEQLVDTTVLAVSNYNKATGSNLWLVAKEHPSDFGRTDYSDLKEKYQREKILFLRYYPTPTLIKQAYAVITINSSVGIEALVQHKPVITLGNAFYNVPGVVVPVRDADQLEQALANLDESVDFHLIEQFLYYLRYEYLAEGSWRAPDEKHLASVKQKLRAIFA